MISRELANQINIRWGRMPYGGICKFDYFKTGNGRGGDTDDEVFPDDLILKNLDELIRVLRRVADENEIIRAERDELHRQRHAVRSFFGIEVE